MAVGRRPEVETILGAHLGVGVNEEGFIKSKSAYVALPEDKDDFRVLVKYSPYHNIKQKTCYPPTLITTSERDDRVVPSHSY